MPSLEDLVRTSPNELVSLCQRVADNRAGYLPAAAEEAAKLKLEWENLQVPHLANLTAPFSVAFAQRAATALQRSWL